MSLYCMSLSSGASGSLSWSMEFADMWGEAVKSPCPAAVCVLAQPEPACSDSVALAVPCPCALLHGGSLGIGKQNCTAASWLLFKHYLHPEELVLWVTNVAFAGKSPKGCRRIEFSSAKIGEPQGTDFLRVMFSPLCKDECLNSRSSGNAGTMENHEPVRNSKFDACSNIYQSFSPTPKSHSLLEQCFHLKLKTSSFLISHARVSCRICRKLYCSYLGFHWKDPKIVNVYLPHLDISQKCERL